MGYILWNISHLWAHGLITGWAKQREFSGTTKPNTGHKPESEKSHVSCHQYSTNITPIYNQRLVSQINSRGGVELRTSVYLSNSGLVMQFWRCFHHFTKLKPKSFVTGPFIGLGMWRWLLGTNSGGTHPYGIPYWNILHNLPEGWIPTPPGRLFVIRASDRDPRFPTLE